MGMRGSAAGAGAGAAKATLLTRAKAPQMVRLFILKGCEAGRMVSMGVVMKVGRFANEELIERRNLLCAS